MSEIIKIKEIQLIRKRISSIESDLEKNKEYYNWLVDSCVVEDDDLYNGLINTLNVEVKEVKEVNNMYGFSQAETEPFFIINTAFVDVKNYYFDKNQKKVITEFMKRKHKISKVRFSR